MLNHHLTVFSNKKTSTPGVLDNLGISNNLIGGFADKKLISSYNGIAYKLVRDSDDEEQDFYFNNNNELPVSDMVSWLNGSNGLVKERGNQANSEKNAYQTLKSSMPILIENGILKANGLDFNGSSNYLIIDDYPAIAKTTPTISIYANYTNNSGHVGFIFSRNDEDTASIQYSHLNFNGNSSMYYSGGNRLQIANNATGTNKDIAVWTDNPYEQLKINSNGNEIDTADSLNPLTNRVNTQIGARKQSTGYTTFYDGNIKTIMIFDSDEYNNYDNFVSNDL